VLGKMPAETIPQLTQRARSSNSDGDATDVGGTPTAMQLAR
jgi:hypothetical protein